eukprot:m.15136 g.15136  ORF g.15136 m.15136 type:complete len:311 (-) comp5300_c0_seq1:76-1008(-)
MNQNLVNMGNTSTKEASERTNSSPSPIWTPEHSDDESDDDMSTLAMKTKKQRHSSIESMAKIGDIAKQNINQAIHASRETASQYKVKAREYIHEKRESAKWQLYEARDQLEKTKIKLQKIANKIDFAWWMTACNFSSSIVGAAYFANLISLRRNIEGEIIIFVVKFAAEIYYGQLKKDPLLLVHHASAIAMFQFGYSYWETVGFHVPLYNTIHFPLLFYNARNMYPEKTHKNHILAQKLFLWTWLPVCFMRLGTSLSALSTPMPMHVHLGALSIPILDYMWTPWHRYRRMIDGHPWVKTLKKKGRSQEAG